MTMRAWVVASLLAVGCGHGGMKPMVAACTRASGADPGACLAVARAKLTSNDEAGARAYVEKSIEALNASPACLRDHAAAGCFESIIVLLREEPVGLLATYDVPEGIRVLSPRAASGEHDSRAQARIALQGMCTVPSGDSIERQRACLVLGDLVEEQRIRRCGPDCDPASAEAKALLADWSPSDVIDGYGAACKIETSPDAARLGAFVEQVKQVYKVAGVCAVASSPARGASIPDALANIERIRTDARVRATSADTAIQREAQRVEQLKKQAADNAAAAARASAAAAKQQLDAAISRGDWQVVFALLDKRSPSEPVDEATATELSRAWDSLAAWGISKSSVIGAYVDLSDSLAKLPAGHPLHRQLEALQARALADARALTKRTRGPGGAWLHAALVARISGPTSAEARVAADAFAKFAAGTRSVLPIDKLAPACAPLIKNEPGRKLRVTSTLACTIVPEKRFTTQDVEQEVTTEVVHRAFAIRARGEITVNGVTTRIDLQEVVDDTDGTNLRTFEEARAAVTEAIWKAVVAPLDAAVAEKAYAAGKKALEMKRHEAAENHLAIHALLAGSSAELDEILSAWRVTFIELLPR